MKNSLTTLFFALLFSLTVFAGSTDNELEPRAPNGFPLQYLSLLDVLYFNQTIDFTVPAGLDITIDHVNFKRGTAEITPAGFRLKIEYANLDEETDELSIYTKDGGGIRLAYSKTITLLQKLTEKGGKSVGDDHDLFLLDGREISLDNISPREQLMHADNLQINAYRFNQENIKLKSFDLQILTGNSMFQLHSEDGSITPAMKAAINKLDERDRVSIQNVTAEYPIGGQQISMNLNYMVNFTIANTN